MRYLVKPLRMGGMINIRHAVLIVSVLVIFVGSGQSADYRTLQRISLNSNGAEGNQNSYFPAISTDGRFIAFVSSATNLVANDTNNVSDIFVRDLQTGATTPISVSSRGEKANGASYLPVFSADGRFVTFTSLANNLVKGDTNLSPDVFVHDRQTGTTSRISVSSSGSQGLYGSGEAQISADGRFIVFRSDASNLVPDDTNAAPDIFLHDRQTGTTSRISVSNQDAQGEWYSVDPSMSLDGRFIAFTSLARNLVKDDTNMVPDIFVHDRQTGTTRRISVGSTGKQGNGGSYDATISADGRFVVFRSDASNLVAGDTNNASDIFVHELQTGVTTRVSINSIGTGGNGNSHTPVLSANGRFIAFVSDASNLVPDDTNGVADIFVHDRKTGATTRVSVDANGVEGNDVSTAPVMSADGRFIAFDSAASNLVIGDNNGRTDIFIAEMLPNASSLVAFPKSERRVAMKWFVGDTTADTYRVERMSGGSWETLATLPNTTVSYVDKKLNCGTTYHYRVIGEGAANSSVTIGSSTATTLACPIEQLINGDFELGGAVPDGWTTHNLSSDKRRCNTTGFKSACGFQFRGKVGEFSVLEQTLPDTSALTAGKRLNLSVWAKGKNAGTVTITVHLTYANGREKTLKLQPSTGSYAYRQFALTQKFMLRRDVSALTLRIVHTGTTGRITLDNVSLTLYAAPSDYTPALRTQVQGDSVLPLPLPSAP